MYNFRCRFVFFFPPLFFSPFVERFRREARAIVKLHRVPGGAERKYFPTNCFRTSCKIDSTRPPSIRSRYYFYRRRGRSVSAMKAAQNAPRRAASKRRKSNYRPTRRITNLFFEQVAPPLDERGRKLSSQSGLYRNAYNLSESGISAYFSTHGNHDRARESARTDEISTERFADRKVRRIRCFIAVIIIYTVNRTSTYRNHNGTNYSRRAVRGYQLYRACGG